MDNFSQSGNSHKACSGMCPISQPSKCPACLQTGPGGHMPKSHPTSASRGLCGLAMGSGNGERWREEREWLRRWDISETQGLIIKTTPPQSSGLKAKDHTCPSLSPLASMLQHPPHLPSTATQKWPPWFSHYIANMQSFLRLKKKKVIISRSNMQIDWV